VSRFLQGDRETKVSAIVSGALVVALLAYLWRSEGSFATLALSMAVVAAVAGLVAAVSGSLASGILVVAGLVAAYHLGARWVSDETSRLMHAYDVLSVLGSPPAIVRTVTAHPGASVVLLVLLLLVAVLATAAARRRSLAVPRPLAAAGVVVASVATAVAAVAMPARPHTLYYFSNIHLSSFLASLPATLAVLVRGRAIEASDEPVVPWSAQDSACVRPDKAPNVILIHQESVAPPELFSTLRYDRSLDDFFRSADGRFRQLRVETYGGASWLSEFSVMTGLSARSFGGLKQVVQPAMAGKIQDTLPQVLAGCGYRTTLFYPMLPSYLDSGRFFSSVGIGETFDAKAQGAKVHDERDRFYYQSALDEFARHRVRSSAPLFAYVQTSAAHWPYSFTYAPEEKVPGGGVGTPPEMNEYLRRLALTRADYRHLKSELARRFPGERFLIVHYGDHQPTATRTLLGFPETADIEDVTRAAPPLAFRTYVAFDVVGTTLPDVPAPAVLDVAYVPTLILEAAGLPLPPSHRERRRLLDRCDGLYFNCIWREDILRFHARLLASGVVDRR
jgi:hypothetical protein